MNSDIVRTQPEYLALCEAAEALAPLAEVLPLSTPEEELNALAVCAEVKGLIARAEKERKALVGPIKQRLKEVDALYREARRPLERLEAQIKARVAQAIEARAKAEREAIAARNDAAQTALVSEGQERQRALEAANAAALAVPEEVRHAGTRTRWVWEPVEVDLRKVPIEYLQLNVPAVRRDAPDIPGIKFEKRAIVAVVGK